MPLDQLSGLSLNDNALTLKERRKPGRPKGSNNKNFLTLQFWYSQMREDLKECKPYQRAIISQKMLQCLMTHDRHLKADTKADELRAGSEQTSEVDLLAKLESENVSESSNFSQL